MAIKSGKLCLTNETQPTGQWSHYTAYSRLEPFRIDPTTVMLDSGYRDLPIGRPGARLGAGRGREPSPRLGHHEFKDDVEVVRDPGALVIRDYIATQFRERISSHVPFWRPSQDQWRCREADTRQGKARKA
jgi:hypothetical protein